MPSPHSVRTYYKLKYAELVKPIVLHLRNNRKRFVMRFDKYPLYKPNTLRLLVFHGWSFLVDKCEGFTQEERASWRIKARSDGLEFEPIEGTETPLVVTEAMQPDPDYMDKLEAFINSGERGRIVLGIPVDAEVKRVLRINLAGLEATEFSYDVGVDRVTLERL